MIDEKTGTVLDRIDNGPGNLYGDGRASLAATHETTGRSGTFIRHIRSAMYDNSSFKRVIIDASFQAFQSQGITILAFIGFVRNIKTRAAFK
jgi:hypothetical protein